MDSHRIEIGIQHRPYLRWMRQLSGSRIVSAEERIGVSAAKSNMSPPPRDARESPHVTRCQKWIVDPGLQKSLSKAALS